MPRHPEKFSIKSRLAIVGSLSIALVALALILSNPTVQRNIVNAVGYSGAGGWTASGTIGGQPYSETWTATAGGYDVSGSLGSDAFNYTFTGSYPDVPGGSVDCVNFRGAASRSDKVQWCSSAHPKIMHCGTADDQAPSGLANLNSTCSGSGYCDMRGIRGGLGGDMIYTELVVKSGGIEGCVTYDDNHGHASYRIDIVCCKIQ